MAHGLQSLADGCASLTVFGTTGEGASLGLNERNRALGAMVGAGVDPARQLVVGIAAASVEDAIAQGRAGLMLGCSSFLLAPPFYFKNPGDEGLFDWLAAVLTGLGPKASNVILYHIPQVTSVGLSVALIDRLKKAFPRQVKGVKDSSGSWENTEALLEHHGGALPFWLAPEQVAVASISHDQAGYAAAALEALEHAGLRAVCFAGAETLSRRILAAHEAAVPVVAILGRREQKLVRLWHFCDLL